MKKLTTLFLMLAICLVASAQAKLTPQAQLKVAKRQKAVERTAFYKKAEAQTDRPMMIRLVVKVADADKASTIAEIRKREARLEGRIGSQVVVVLPVDSVESLSRIGGVVRVDMGHKGRFKTDVTRQATGVARLNGPTLPEEATAYTGKGVTICLIDAGFDFQHPAFKDAEGRSRIKCVYLMGDDKGHKFTVSDPDLGEYDFPGSVYDTPELIATLTTDDAGETHGTHTAGIAAGSLSPQGFGGMAPEADLVLIPLNDVEEEGFDEADEEEYVELALAFAAAYAQQSEQPVVLSASLNSHGGPHDGTSSMTEAIENVSGYLVPVFSAGNEGGYPIHLYQQFSAAKKSVKSIMLGLMEDETGEHRYLSMSDIAGFVRKGDEASLQLTLVSVNQFTGRLTTVWTSETVTATPGCEAQIFVVSSDDDATLAQHFDGMVGVGALQDENGRLCVAAMTEGGIDKLYFWIITVGGSAGTEIDLWDEMAGFGGVNTVGLSGYADGDSDISAGDWTCTEHVISVGAYCANVQERSFNGTVTDTSVAEDEDDDADTLDDIAWFSSYGTSFNDITQPVVCAPGVNVVSSVNHYYYDYETYAAGMQWDGYPYDAESGTSMSCPTVAGIIALWLQACPTLTFQQVKEVLENSSDNDDFTAANPVRWGYGKINAKAGLDYIEQNITGIHGLVNTTPVGNVWHDLQGRRVNNPTRGIYIANGRKFVVK